MDQGIDSSLKKDPLKTKCTTFQQYVDCYAGPQVELHLRYAFIFNNLYVTFTYGLALPVLFPIMFFTMFN